MTYARPKARFPFFSAAAAALILASPALAQPRDRAGEAAAPAAPSPFFGIWELDLTRMPDTYGPPPKRVTFTFEEIGSGMWRTSVNITAQDDSVRHSAVQYRRDGRAVQGEGDRSEADSAALSSPAPNVLVMCLAKNGRASVRTYVISPDGREMTESAANVDNAGAPFVRSFHFRRIR
jgi:hypothetical protein